MGLTLPGGGSSGGSSVAGSSLVPTAVKTTNYTAASSDYVPVDTTSGNVTITLPTAPADKTQVGIKHVVRDGTNVVTLACGGSDVLNKTGGSTTGTLTLLNQSTTLQYKASSGVWYVVGGDLPLSQLDTRYQAASSAVALAEQGSWAPGVVYSVGDVQTSGTKRYICRTAHTSGSVFTTDLAAQKWVALDSGYGDQSPVGFPGIGFRRLQTAAVADRSAQSKGLRNPRLFIENGVFYVYADTVPYTGDQMDASDGIGLWTGTSLTSLTYQGLCIPSSAVASDVGDASPYLQSGGVFRDNNGLYHMYACATDTFNTAMTVGAGGIYHFTSASPTFSSYTLVGKEISNVTGERVPLDNSTPVYWNGQWVIAFMSYLTAWPSRSVVIATSPDNGSGAPTGTWTRQGTNPTARGGYALVWDGPELIVDNGMLILLYCSDDYSIASYDLSDLLNAYYLGPVLQLNAGTTENGSASWGRGGYYRDPRTGRAYYIWQARGTGYYKVFAAAAAPKVYVSHSIPYFSGANNLAVSGTQTVNLPSSLPREAYLIDVQAECKDTAITQDEYIELSDGYVTNYPMLLRPQVANHEVALAGLLPTRALNWAITVTCSGTTAARLWLTIKGYWRLP